MVISGCHVLTLDPQRHAYPSGYVAIDGNLITEAGPAPGRPLVQVMMGVDQAGGGQAAGGVDLRGPGQAFRDRAGPDLRDQVPVDRDVPARVRVPLRVHGYDVTPADDHHEGSSSQRSAARRTASRIFS